jgi:thymidylate kinase
MSPPTIALIGPDGAGKSTIARLVAADLPFPARYLYMGVNLESSNELLPTTRLILGLKRAGGRRPDLTGRTGPTLLPGSGIAHSIRRFARVGAWMAEEWYRAALAGRARRAGKVVIFDRHFFCDYYATDIRPVSADGTEPRRTLAARIHGGALRRWYPRPDLAILLDAPAEVLISRKAGGTLESVEIRRRQYHDLASVLPAFAIVDASQTLEPAVQAVRERIIAFVDAWNASGSGARRAGVSGETAPRTEPGPPATTDTELEEAGLAAIR